MFKYIIMKLKQIINFFLIFILILNTNGYTLAISRVNFNPEVIALIEKKIHDISSRYEGLIGQFRSLMASADTTAAPILVNDPLMIMPLLDVSDNGRRRIFGEMGTEERLILNLQNALRPHSISSMQKIRGHLIAYNKDEGLRREFGQLLLYCLTNKIINIEKLLAGVDIKNFMELTFITPDDLFLTGNVSSQYIVNLCFDGDMQSALSNKDARRPALFLLFKNIPGHQEIEDKKLMEHIEYFIHAAKSNFNWSYLSALPAKALSYIFCMPFIAGPACRHGMEECFKLTFDELSSAGSSAFSLFDIVKAMAVNPTEKFKLGFKIFATALVGSPAPKAIIKETVRIPTEYKLTGGKLEEEVDKYILKLKKYRPSKIDTIMDNSLFLTISSPVRYPLRTITDLTFFLKDRIKGDEIFKDPIFIENWRNTEKLARLTAMQLKELLEDTSKEKNLEKAQELLHKITQLILEETLTDYAKNKLIDSLVTEIIANSPNYQNLLLGDERDLAKRLEMIVGIYATIDEQAQRYQDESFAPSTLGRLSKASFKETYLLDTGAHSSHALNGIYILSKTIIKWAQIQSLWESPISAIPRWAKGGSYFDLSPANYNINKPIEIKQEEFTLKGGQKVELYSNTPYLEKTVDSIIRLRADLFNKSHFEKIQPKIQQLLAKGCLRLLTREEQIKRINNLLLTPKTYIDETVEFNRFEALLQILSYKLCEDIPGFSWEEYKKSMIYLYDNVKILKSEFRKNDMAIISILEGHGVSEVLDMLEDFVLSDLAIRLAA